MPLPALTLLARILREIVLMRDEELDRLKQETPRGDRRLKDRRDPPAGGFVRLLFRITFVILIVGYVLLLVSGYLPVLCSWRIQ